jgi:hypothetical protein
MALSKFIMENTDEILSEWEKFAKTIPAAAGMDAAALRDETAKILAAIARDMEHFQCREDQEVTSKSEAVRPAPPIQLRKCMAATGWDLVSI